MKHKRAKVTESTATVREKKYTRYVATWYDDDGKRQRKTFAKKSDATAEAKQINRDQEQKESAHKIIRNKIGEDAAKLDAAKLRDAADALTILKGFSTLSDAARFYMKYAKPDGGEITLKDCLEKFTKDRTDSGLRMVTIKGYATKVKTMNRALGENALVNTITPQRFKEWLSGHTTNQGTRKAYIRTLHAFFQFAVNEKYTVENPVQNLTAKADKTPTTYLTPDAAAKLLGAAQEHDPKLVPYIALGLFAGLRPAEIHGQKTEHAPLDWQDIHLRGKNPHIDIKPKQDKNREGRFVDISANLMQWLTTHAEKSGPIEYTRWRYESIVKKSGVKVPKDVLRHSFGTWHWAMHRHEGETAIQMGDTIKTVKKHYVNQRVTEENAAKFWGITPERKGNVIEMQKAG
jgi:integrase